eukprot:gene15970-21672_t
MKGQILVILRIFSWLLKVSSALILLSNSISLNLDEINNDSINIKPYISVIGALFIVVGLLYLINIFSLISFRDFITDEIAFIVIDNIIGFVSDIVLITTTIGFFGILKSMWVMNISALFIITSIILTALRCFYNDIPYTDMANSIMINPNAIAITISMILSIAFVETTFLYYIHKVVTIYYQYDSQTIPQEILQTRGLSYFTFSWLSPLFQSKIGSMTVDDINRFVVLPEWCGVKRNGLQLYHIWNKIDAKINQKISRVNKKKNLIYSLIDLYGYSYIQIGIISFLQTFLTFSTPFLIAYYQKYYNDLVLHNKDKRMKSTGEVFQSILIVKLNDWEKQFMERIAENRKLELNFIWKTNLCSAFMVFTLWLSPCIVSVSTIATYAFIMKQDITASKIFTSM